MSAREQARGRSRRLLVEGSAPPPLARSASRRREELGIRLDLGRNRGATGGPQRPFEVTGVTFDSREVQPGDLFVAMPGTVHDGHRFVDGAFASGAAGRHRLAAGQRPARPRRRHRRRARRPRPRVARAQPREDHRRHRLGRQDQHQGSAVRRARPQPAGQGPPLGQELQQSYRRAAQPRPHAARRRLCGVRNGHEQRRRNRRADPRRFARTSRSSPRSRPRTSRSLGSEEAIADAKAEIFEGLEPGGTAIIPFDSPHRDRLVKAARRHADRIVTFGARRCRRPRDPRRRGGGRRQPDQRGAARARADLHHFAARRALGVQCAGRARRGRSRRRRLGLAGLALADLGGLKGRGERHRIDVRRRRSAADRRKLQRQSGLDGGDAEEPGAKSGRRAPHRGARPDARAGRAWRRAPRRLGAGRPRGAGRSSHPDRRGDGAARRRRLPASSRVERGRRCRRGHRGALQSIAPRPATRCWSRDPMRSGLRSWSSAWQGGWHALRDRRAARLPRHPQPLPLHQLPRRRGERDRAAHRPAARAEVHRLAARQAGQGPADPHRRPAEPSRQARHADHGRAADPDLGRDLGPAVDGPPQSLRLGLPAGHGRLRADRLPRRLRQGPQGAPRRPVGQDAAARSSSSSPASPPGSSSAPAAPASTCRSSRKRWSTSAGSTSSSAPS